MSNLTLFSDKVELDDGFVTKTYLYQGTYCRASYVWLGFFLHSPPRPILEEIISRKSKGWFFNEGTGSISGFQSYMCYQTGLCDFQEEWAFACSTLKHPDRIQTQEELSHVMAG